MREIRVPLGTNVQALFGICLVLMAWLSIPRAVSADDSEESAWFESKIRPILSRHCDTCHSAKTKSQSGLVLDSRADWLEGGYRGPAVKPGDPDASLLIQAVRHSHAELKMPREKLAAREIDLLVEWVKRGAPGPVLGKYGDSADRLRHWAYQPIQNPDMPTVKNAHWPRSDIDRFILARLEEESLSPVADADRRSLIRRATFDLIGLPPTRKEVEDFCNDPDPNAFAKVVDRLLHSPHFGEHWARHWFDLARFAESTGATNDILLTNAWRYRDYVIDALNRDLRYDRFLTEQIAGDLLPYENPQERDRQIIATGFLAMGQYDYDKPDPQTRLDQIDEQIDVVSRAILATTISCARCHDHKFDPISTKDYYALAGILSSTTVRKLAVYTRGKHTLVRIDTGVPLQGYDAAQVAEFTRLNEMLYAGRNPVVRMGWEVNRLKKAFAKTPDQKQRQVLETRLGRLQTEIARRKRAEREAFAKLQDFPPLPPMAMAVQEGQPHNEAVRIRGEFDAQGTVVPRGLPAALTNGAAPQVPKDQSGRRQLAEWITDKSNPLTARVAVNRLWHHLFGRGLVGTLDNFGLNGERPSHPQLLDSLATRFQEDGWSIKRTLRRMMLSRTYQLSTQRHPAAEEIDADNRLLWRAHRRRLQAEQFRDSVLAFSGELDLIPQQKSRIWELGYGAMRFIDQSAAPPFVKEPFSLTSNKRSIYLPQPRGRQSEILALFDGVDNRTLTAQRDLTTVPSQALLLLNSPEILTHARNAAQRLLATPNVSQEERIDQAFGLAFARPATAAEKAIAAAFLANERRANSSQEQAWTAFCQLLVAAPEFRYLN